MKSQGSSGSVPSFRSCSQVTPSPSQSSVLRVTAKGFHMGIVDNLVDSPAEWSAVGFVCKGATPKEEVSPKTNMASDTLAI